MQNDKTKLVKGDSETRKLVQIRTLEDLVNLNLDTLNGVVNETMDNKKAGLIFTGSRTVCVTLKLGIEAMKLGLRTVGGVAMGDGIKTLGIDDKANQIK